MGAIKLNGSTSGHVEITAPAVAGTQSVEFPTDVVQKSEYRGHNLLHNGAMQVAQRGASFAGTAGIVYTADRWFTYRAGGATGHTVTWAASGLAKIQYCARVQRDSGNASTAGVFLEQDIETVNSIPVQGDTVTLSFWARKGATYSAASGAMDVLVQSGTGTDQRIQSGFAGAASVVSTAVTLTADWQRFTVTGSVPASSAQLGVRFGFTPVGTASTGDYFEVTGVQLETGSAATGFEFKGYEQELAECQRYYYHHAGGANAHIAPGVAFSASELFAYVPFPVTMRVAPLLVQATGADYYLFYRSGGTQAFTAFSLAVSSPSLALLNNASLTHTAGVAGMVSCQNPSAYVALSADL